MYIPIGILYTTWQGNIVEAMDYVEFSFHCLFEVVQYPARCCMLLQQTNTNLLFQNTTSAAAGGAGCRVPRTTAPRVCVCVGHFYISHPLAT